MKTPSGLHSKLWFGRDQIVATHQFIHPFPHSNNLWKVPWMKYISLGVLFHVVFSSDQ